MQRGCIVFTKMDRVIFGQRTAGAVASEARRRGAEGQVQVLESVLGRERAGEFLGAALARARAANAEVLKHAENLRAGVLPELPVRTLTASLARAAQATEFVKERAAQYDARFTASARLAAAPAPEAVAATPLSNGGMTATGWPVSMVTAPSIRPPCLLMGGLR